MHNLTFSVWVDEINMILQHTKKTVITDYPVKSINRLFVDRALPKQAAMALVVEAKRQKQ